jgi:hypothetical protein
MPDVRGTVHLIDGRLLDLFDWAVQTVCARHEPFGDLQVGQGFLVRMQHGHSSYSSSWLAISANHGTWIGCPLSSADPGRLVSFSLPMVRGNMVRVSYTPLNHSSDCFGLTHSFTALLTMLDEIRCARLAPHHADMITNLSKDIVFSDGVVPIQMCTIIYLLAFARSLIH